MIKIVLYLPEKVTIKGYQVWESLYQIKRHILLIAKSFSEKIEVASQQKSKYLRWLPVGGFNLDQTIIEKHDQNLLKWSELLKIGSELRCEQVLNCSAHSPLNSLPKQITITIWYNFIPFRSSIFALPTTVGIIICPQQCPYLILRACEYVMLHAKGVTVADGFKIANQPILE